MDHYERRQYLHPKIQAARINHSNLVGITHCRPYNLEIKVGVCIGELEIYIAFTHLQMAFKVPLHPVVAPELISTK